MQKAQEGRSRLKRVTLIGDHHQLPPVFTRFVRLGSPFIQLNAQVQLKLQHWRVPPARAALDEQSSAAAAAAS